MGPEAWCVQSLSQPSWLLEQKEAREQEHAAKKTPLVSVCSHLPRKEQPLLRGDHGLSVPHHQDHPGHPQSQVEFQLPVLHQGPGAGRAVHHGVRAGPVLPGWCVRGCPCQGHLQSSFLRSSIPAERNQREWAGLGDDL